MFGAVFAAEMLRAGRRGNIHVLRWLFAAWLTVQAFFYFQADNKSRFATTAREFINVLLVQHFVLLILVTPAFAAGAITDEKTTGTLDQLLATHLSPAAIVGGKLLARAMQVGLLGLTTLPMLAFFGPFAGVPPEFVVALIVVTALMLLGLSAVSMLASVWTKTTRSAVLAVYFLFGTLVAVERFGWVLIPRWVLEAFHPQFPLEVAFDRVDPTEVARRLQNATLAYGAVTLVCWLLASWRLRPAYVRQLQARPTKLRRVFRFNRPRPTLDVLAWKECYVGRWLPGWLSLTLMFALGVAVATMMSGGWRPGRELSGVVFWQLLLVSTVVGVRASGSVVGERERKTWEGLLTTPLSFRELVQGKLRGIVIAAWPFVWAFDLGLVTAKCARGPFDLAGLGICVGLAVIAAAVGFAVPKLRRYVTVVLLLAVSAVSGVENLLVIGAGLVLTWLAMQFFGGIGMWSSVRSKSSWRSLLGTVSVGYVGGVALMCISTPLGCIASILWMLLAALLGQFEQIVSGSRTGGMAYAEFLVPVFWSLGAGIAYWWVAHSMLLSAERHLERTERIPTGYVRYIEQDGPMRPIGPFRRKRGL